MLPVRLTVDDEKGQQLFCSFWQGYQDAEALGHKSEHPEANVILYTVVNDGTKRYGPLIDRPVFAFCVDEVEAAKQFLLDHPGSHLVFYRLLDHPDGAFRKYQVGWPE